MIINHIVRIANLLKLSIEDATAYCEEVRRASGLGKQLSDASIARHLLGKKPPYPEPSALASIIKQQETFRITTGRSFSVSRSQEKESSKPSTTPNPDLPIAVPRETLEKCPYCKKMLKAEYLPEHKRLLHADDLKLALKKENLKTPLLDGIEVQSPDLIKDLKRRVIDEQGFLVSPDLIPETKMNDSEERHFHRTGVARNVKQSNVFDKIKSAGSAIPGARIKKLRPEPNQQVLCPVCQKHVAYQDLFNHVEKRHPEQKAKLVLARFNREYEMWAKQTPNQHRGKKDKKW